MSAPERATALQRADPSHKFVMSDNGVEVGVQAVIYHAGFNCSGTFCAITRDERSLRACLKDAFGLDVYINLGEGRRASNAVNAWQSAKTAKTCRGELEVEGQVSQIIRSITQ